MVIVSVPHVFGCEADLCTSGSVVLAVCAPYNDFKVSIDVLGILLLRD